MFDCDLDGPAAARVEEFEFMESAAVDTTEPCTAGGVDGCSLWELVEMSSAADEPFGVGPFRSPLLLLLVLLFASNEFPRNGRESSIVGRKVDDLSLKDSSSDSGVADWEPHISHCTCLEGLRNVHVGQDHSVECGGIGGTEGTVPDPDDAIET